MNKAGKGKAFQKELHKLSDMFKERLIFFFWSDQYPQRET